MVGPNKVIFVNTLKTCCRRGKQTDNAISTTLRFNNGKKIIEPIILFHYFAYFLARETGRQVFSWGRNQTHGY